MMANFCKNCGCAVSSSQKYCSNCGSSLDSTEATNTSKTAERDNTGSFLGTIFTLGILGSLLHPFCHPHIHHCHGPFGGMHFGGPHGGFGGHGGFHGGHH